MRLGLHHVAGALAGPAEILYLDRGSGGPAVAEMADPRLVEGRPVPLQVPHEDADPHDIGQAGPAADKMAARFAKIWSASWPASAGSRPVCGSFPNRAETKIQPPDSTACGTGPVWWGASAVSMTFTTPVSGIWVVGRSEYDQDGQVLGDVKEVVVPAAVHRDDVAWPQISGNRAVIGL